MLDFRPITYALGVLITLLGAGMLIPAAMDILISNPDWITFVSSSFVTLFIGGAMVLSTQGTAKAFSLKQAFLMTTLSWILLPIFAAIPFSYSVLDLSYTDAYFEAMSGLTTTGSTVISGLDDMPPGLHLWRALLQWYGGLGIVVMTIAILPILQVGGMQLFMTEGFDTRENMLPRATQISSELGKIYILLTIAAFVALMMVGMTPFEALVHAMTSVSTGGFSTSDSSIGYFDSAAVDFVITFFMLMGSLPFILFMHVLRGKYQSFFRDEQVQAFLYTLGFLIVFGTFWLVYFKQYDLFNAVRYSSFNIISVMTGTGYTSMDYSTWGHFASSFFFMIMFIGGCAGSTSCGIKIFRFQVLFKALKTWIAKNLYPNGVFIPRYNGAKLSDDIIRSVMSFFAFFLIIYLILTVLVATTGVDWLTAFSATGTAIANVGPGLGDIVGPAGNFGPLPDSTKWLLSLAMVFGRLELFAVLVLFSRNFWRT